MKIWKKVIFDNSNKISEFKENNSFEYQKKIKGRYKNWSYSSDVNENYEDKSIFLNHYLKARYLVWDKYLKQNLKNSNNILSIGSGRAINELSLINENYKIICSDLEIPKSYDASKKLFGDFEYIKFDILKDVFAKKFNVIFSMHTFYLFSKKDLELSFKKINNMLNNDGILIIDFNTEDKIFSYLYHNIYLIFESFLIYSFSKIFRKNIGLKIDANCGFHYKKKEILEMAKLYGFDLVEYNEFDYLAEARRSQILKKIMYYFPFSEHAIKKLFYSIPYHRIFKFRKNDHIN